MIPKMRDMMIQGNIDDLSKIINDLLFELSLLSKYNSICWLLTNLFVINISILFKTNMNENNIDKNANNNPGTKVTSGLLEMNMHKPIIIIMNDKRELIDKFLSLTNLLPNDE